MKTRKEALEDALFYRLPVAELEKQLAAFPWDCEEPIVFLKRSHILAAIDLCLALQISFSQLESWTNLLEGREDIGFELGYEEIVQDAVHQLANPLLTVPITLASLQVLRERIKG